MTNAQHLRRHKILHNALEELVADYLLHTHRPLNLSFVEELLKWSYEQTRMPLARRQHLTSSDKKIMRFETPAEEPPSE